ncbi:CBS-domain-containing protein [Rhizoclosmatium globosum]|uniref:CBS-domain-containing protein n=1 Tax=Rhizoclosmatium globosum TaxID=329046 RepID=A0A1Y2CJD0_9FUNG|nr:CBS-domain-containing protein [Rhizoclosmatium globosum]|eukprot:ORY46415.1 CBS-domain-containing protein [Rhizoclosmatium globosum]
MSVASVPQSNFQPPVYNKRSKGYSSTVASLKPAQAITVLETPELFRCSDAVLVDIAYRVVAEGLDLRQTTVSQCMTRNPIAVLDKGPRNEALSTMVSRRFRHLPVIAAEEEDGVDAEMGSTTTTATSTNVVGLLDITKCVFERLDDLEKKVLEDANIVAAMEALERRGHLAMAAVEGVRAQHGCPDLLSVLHKNDANGEGDVPEVGIKASVRDAAKMMKQMHQTAVLVLAQGEEKLHGIFTTKDIVLRVIAAGLDPATTSVVRVMTPHPDSVDASTSILDALKKLHVGHYLHLPVVEGSVPIGLVDVLTLTMAMLDYLMNKETGADASANDSAAVDPSGPMWNKFWNSTFNNGSIIDTESAESFDDDSLQIGHMPERFSPAPPQPYMRVESPPPVAPSTILSGSQSLDPSQFGYKLRDKRSGKVHRFTSSSMNVSDVYAVIRAKTGGAPGCGDMILLGSNADLEEAVGMARRFGWERLVLHKEKEKEVAPAAVEEHPRAASNRRSTQRRASVAEGGVTEFLRDAPLAVNVALSAGIVVVAAFVMSRFSR